MKLLLVLLACVAAANALSFHYHHGPAPYAYSYYCSHSWHVYPISSYYCFHVYFPHTWCSHSYYSSILKCYPGSDCGGHCWSERRVSDIVNEIRNLLSAQRARMCHEMYRRRDSFLHSIIYLHNTYKWWFHYYIYRLYSYRMHYCIYHGRNYYAERLHRITVYCTHLDHVLSSVRSKYNAAISYKISVLTHYHDRIVKAAEHCLNTRLAKIAEFRRHLDHKIYYYIQHFSNTHYAFARQNRDHYKAILSSLFCEYSHDWWINFKASIAVNYYYSRQRSLVYHYIYSYKHHLYSIRHRLITYYTCCYKCYMYSGCLRFFSQEYRTKTHSLGYWWHYRRTYCADHYYLAPFKVKFHPCHFKVLKTCDVNKVVGDISGVISYLEHQKSSICKSMEHKFHHWYYTWIHHFYAYKHAFWTIVNRRHAFLCTWQHRIYMWHCGYLSAANIAYIHHMKHDLHLRAIRACNSYYSHLLHSIYAARSQHQHNHQKFIDSVNHVIATVKAKFNACKAKRLVDIAAYKRKLDAHTRAQRSALYNSFWAAKVAHWSKFNNMLRHYHGSCYYKYYWISAMRSCYAHALVNRCHRVMWEFDHFWHYMNPRLLQHYSCCYKCKVGAYVMPHYYCGRFYHWHYCLPTEHTYTYKYHFWYTHYQLCL